MLSLCFLSFLLYFCVGSAVLKTSEGVKQPCLEYSSVWCEVLKILLGLTVTGLVWEKFRIASLLERLGLRGKMQITLSPISTLGILFSTLQTDLAFLCITVNTGSVVSVTQVLKISPSSLTLGKWISGFFIFFSTFLSILFLWTLVFTLSEILPGDFSIYTIL